MSSTNVDVVRDQFAAVNERDFGRAMDGYAEDVVLVVPPELFLESGTFEGREAVGRGFGDWFSTFGPGYRFDIEEARDVGDTGDLVLIVASHTGRGRGSGVEVSGHTGYLYTVRDGKVARVEVYAGREEALEAASREG